MGKEYLTRSNLTRLSVAVYNLMKTRLDKMVVIRMKSRQRTKSEKVKTGYMKRIKQTLVLEFFKTF